MFGEHKKMPYLCVAELPVSPLLILNTANIRIYLLASKDFGKIKC